MTHKISEILGPTPNTFTSEERHLLFLIRERILAALPPLRLCGLLSRSQCSLALPIVVQVETILSDTLYFVHPILLGQAPMAAAQNAARTNDADFWPPGCRIRATLKTKLAEYSERLELAIQLLNTALLTIKTTLNKFQKPSSICYVTLTKAAQTIATWGSSFGDLFSLQGMMLLAGADRNWHLVAQVAVLKLSRLRRAGSCRYSFQFTALTPAPLCCDSTQVDQSMDIAVSLRMQRTFQENFMIPSSCACVGGGHPSQPPSSDWETVMPISRAQRKKVRATTQLSRKVYMRPNWGKNVLVIHADEQKRRPVLALIVDDAPNKISKCLEFIYTSRLLALGDNTVGLVDSLSHELIAESLRGASDP